MAGAVSSLNTELAAAARWVRAAAERIPEDQRPDIAREWGQLMSDVDDARSEGAGELIVIQWRQDMGERLSTKLAHSPLENF